MLFEAARTEKAGVCLLEWRKLVCGAMIAIAPSALFAQYSERALLRNDGGTWLNESPAPAVSAIFPDSLIQTQADHSARIEAEGSTVSIGGETVVQFQGLELALDHGLLQLDTSREMKVLIGCITITPVNSDRTQYTVTDLDGKVKISAVKSDVKVHLHSGLHRTKQSASSDFIVHEGEQKSHGEHCGGYLPRPADGASINAGWLNSTVASWGGVGAIAVTCFWICRGGEPISPAKP
jgi:hypothetical protein